jgi:recombination protein RecA
MSQALRKLAGTLNKSRTTAVFINQLREKIGVMFGCLSYGTTRVTSPMAPRRRSGRSSTSACPSRCFRMTRVGEDRSRRGVNWFDNGRTDEFLRFTVARGGGNGRDPSSPALPTTQIRTPGGWREAQDLQVGDQGVAGRAPLSLDAAAGSHPRRSDGRLRPVALGEAVTGPVSAGDTVPSRLPTASGRRRSSPICRSRGATTTRAPPSGTSSLFRSSPSCAEPCTWVVEGLSWDYLKELTPLSLAIWYMDDASFAIRSKGLQERTAGGSGRAEICVEALEATSVTPGPYLGDTWGVNGKLDPTGRKGGPPVPDSGDRQTPGAHRSVCPSRMEYKLLPRFRGRFEVEPVFAPMRRVGADADHLASSAARRTVGLLIASTSK